MRTYLKKLREARGLSQQEVATALSIAPNYYGYIENGERQQDIKFSTLVKLSKVFGVTLSDISKQENAYQADNLSKS